MRLLKKIVRKIYHLIWFLSLFMIFFTPVKAETVNMTFSNFRTYASSYGIVSNSEIYSTTTSVPINMSAVAAGSPFEWITSYNMTCTGNTVITGRFRFDGNANLTYDFLQDNIKEIYYAPNISGVSSTPCSWSVNPNNLQVSFTCTTNQPNSNFIVGGRWRYRTGSFSAQYLVWRNMNITCDNSASAIIENNNSNTQNIINNNNSNTQKEVDAINGVESALTDETQPNIVLSDLNVPSDTPISDLITMPLTILNSLVQTLDGSCQNYTIPFFNNTTVTFPCFTISDYLTENVTNYIDLFICFYMCYNIGMLCISIFEDITSLRDIYDSLYTPKHADTGYKPRHGGDA